ncbi:MAG: AbrB/MazE/SpoVT family DNA-binding domain-containing protein [Chloroflexi bacterium]|nr:AbrB/MazE/SpoVT family DNA-binding domain-containing protein [Chloroflexota bacterium]
MIQTRLSSKGQVVIPKPIRDALGLQAGTPFRVRLQEQAIVLEPVRTSPIDTLYGKYSGTDLLTKLETEHQREIRNETPVRP